MEKEVGREDLIAYGIPMIILSTTGTGLGLYLMYELGQRQVGYPVFLISFGLTMLFIIIFIIPAVSSYMEDYLESFEDYVGED